MDYEVGFLLIEWPLLNLPLSHLGVYNLDGKHDSGSRIKTLTYTNSCFFQGEPYSISKARTSLKALWLV